MTGSPAFSINEGTGQITANSGMDHEAQDAYTLTVTAADPHGATVQVTVTITVGNLDEPGTVTLDNTSPKAGDAVTATLADPDGETSSEAWQWQRSGSDIEGANSGSYTAAAADLGHTLSVMVNYNDPQGADKSATSAETAAVSNDPPTFTTGDPVNLPVAEDAAPGSPVGDPLEAADPNGDTLSYSLTGDGAGDFAVDGAGQITTAAALDHEARSSYTLTATVSDPAGGSGSITVNISVENVEEPGAVTFGTNAQPEVNTPLTASLTDPDGSVTGERWQWQSSDSAAGPWADIDGAESASHTPQSGDVNRYLQANVTYTDGHGASEDTASAVTALPVRPEPNRPPQFLDAVTGFNISVNVNEGIRVAPPFTAEDPNGDELTYSIVLDTADSFTIDPATGEVRMGSLDIEEDDVFTATVQVTDGFGEDGYPDTAIDDSLDITITIVDPNIVVTTPDRTYQPFGLWANDDVIITTNRGSTDWVRFYDADDGSPIADRHFKLKYVTGPRPKDIWSDGETVYVLDQVYSSGTNKIYAYGLDDGKRRKSREITLHPDNRAPGGLWGQDDVIYVSDAADNMLYPYDLDTRQHISSGRVTLAVESERGIGQIGYIWSDGDTVWVTRWLSHWVRAYDLETGARIPRLDIQMARANYGSTGIHSDGFNFWSIERVQNTVYGYILPQ